MPEVPREDHGSKRRYVIRYAEGEAKLTLSVLSPDHVLADHPYVPDERRGQSLADRLLDALTDARTQGLRSFRSALSWPLGPDSTRSGQSSSRAEPTKAKFEIINQNKLNCSAERPP